MGSWISLILYFSVLFGVVDCGLPTPTWKDATELYDNLSSKSYKHVRPTEDYSQAMEVNITFSIVAINEINEVSGTMAFTSFIIVSWKDEKMKWDILSSGLIFTMMPFDEVWTPNLVVVNPGGEMKKIGDDYTYVRYVFDGRAYWQPTIIMSTACDIDITYFPFDTQVCNVMINSWMNTPSEVKLAAPVLNANMDYFRKNGEWDVKSITHELIENEHFSIVQINFELKRKPIFHVVNIILPIVFLGFINPLVFILPVECGERISYAITVLLSFAVFMTLVSDRMPETSEPQAVISVFLVLMLVYSVAIMLLTILSLRLYFRNDNKPVPKYARKILMVLTFQMFFPKKTFIEPVRTKNLNTDGPLQESNENQLNTKNEADNNVYFADSDPFADWKNVAVTVDFILFVFSVAFFIILTAAFLIYIGK